MQQNPHMERTEESQAQKRLKLACLAYCLGKYT